MRGRVLSCVLVTLILAVLSIYVAAVTLPHSFEPGTPISSAEVNANFEALRDGKQDRVAEACTPGSAIRAIHDDGTVECEAAAEGAGVASLNEQTGALTLEAGSNVVLDDAQQGRIVISAFGGEGFAGIASDATLTGDGTAANPLGISPARVDSAHLADQAVTLEKISTQGAAADDVLTFDGQELIWRAPQGGAGTGANQHIVAGEGLVGGGSGDELTLSVGAGSGLETSAEAVSIAAPYRLPQTCQPGQLVSYEAGAGSWTCTDNPGSDFWSLTGNEVTDAETQFLGTTDDEPLNFRVDNEVALRIRPRAVSGFGFSPNISLGSSGIDSHVIGGTVSGGGGDHVPELINRVSGNYGTVGGGLANTAGQFAVISGGRDNQAGSYAVVPGGRHNEASGEFSFAAGRRAKAEHDGAFVWADAIFEEVASERDNQFRVAADGGVRFDVNLDNWVDVRRQILPQLPGGIVTKLISTSTGAYLSGGGEWVNASDVALKENFAPVDQGKILAQLSSLPIQSWNYLAEGAGNRHIGPTAQDFRAIFGVGSETGISTVDASGVALAAIQGLHQLVLEQELEITALREQQAVIEKRLAALEEHLARGETE